MVLRFSRWHLSLALCGMCVACGAGFGRERGSSNAEQVTRLEAVRSKVLISAAVALLLLLLLRCCCAVAVALLLLRCCCCNGASVASKQARTRTGYWQTRQEHSSTHSLVMNPMNSDTHSWMASFASFAILALFGSAFFMMRLMFAIGRKRSCSLAPAPPA